MAIELYELRVGNAVYCLISRNRKVITSIVKGGQIDNNQYEPIPITKENLRDNLGFSIIDMGDFWQCEKEDFILIQVKLSFGTMPYMFVLKSSIKESVNFYHVHHLQNTYLDLKGELLLWQK